MIKKVLAETALYRIETETVKSQITLTGCDEIYAVINKDTGVTEGRGATFPDALGFMHSVQLGYENVMRQAAQINAANNAANSGEDSEEPGLQ